MQKLQDSVFSILKTTSLSPAVFSFLQPTEDFPETPLGGILRDTKFGWLALGPKFCVVDLRNGLKVAAKTFGNSSTHTTVTSVIELPHPLTNSSQQLVISLETDDTCLICILHINGSQILRCIGTDVIITELALCDDVKSGPFTCFDGLLMAGTQKGEVLVIDLNRNALIQALTDITEGNSHLIKNETDPATLSFISIKTLYKYERKGELPINNNEHHTILLNEDSFIDNQYIFRNPDGTVRMKAQKDHVRVTVIQYMPQLGSLVVGYNFGAFQLWNIFDLALVFTSQVNVECLPVTHFGFQEPCDDPRAFCYLWVVFSVTNRFEEYEFPLAVMYSLTYQGKRMLVDNKCLYQEFSSATICFQVELGAMEHTNLLGGRCISTHTFSINTMMGEEGEDTMLNLCQLVWECWGDQATSSHYGMLLFDLDQWYKDQMPATYQLQSNAFMSTAWCSELGRGSLTLDLRLDPSTMSPYSHATRLEEHFYPNSLQYNCVCLNTSEAITLHTAGIQRQIISSISTTGPSCLLSPARLYTACMSAGLMPSYITADTDTSVDEQRKFLLSVALEARMSQFLKRCAQDWATGTHTGVGCTLTFLVDWAWKRAVQLKENAKELISPLFTSATLPDRNVIRCLEHCVQQLSQLTGLLDAILTKCCSLVVPEALSEIEEKYKGIGTVSLYFQVIQWVLRVGLLPERNHPHASLPYPSEQLYSIYKKRRAKLHRIQEDTIDDDSSCVPSSLLYVDQLIINEFGGKTVHQMWIRAGSDCGGLYPPPSLYALLRLYLLPDISEEYKHSLLLYLLLDYSMIYDDAQYEAVIRRLMQFPPMFGLSTTLVRATQAFWHLDHRDFHFALDQLQCLTGNTLSDWQHHVVLSSLLAQKKSQAALQYLYVRKPAPIQNKGKIGNSPNNAVNGHDKLEDWQSFCNLYLARGLVFEALDVVRMCVQNAGSMDDKITVLNYFFKACRNSGQLSKVLQASLLPLEEEAFINYLKESNEPQTSDILIMYYLQQARYLEAEQFNKQVKTKNKGREMCRSAESMSDLLERENARDVLVEVMCGSVPKIASAVARFATHEFEPHVLKPKPMSVYVKTKSHKNIFTYKSSFIQDTIENASETWINKPKTMKGLKRVLNIDETPFICTPKLHRTKSVYERQNGSTQAKRAKLDLSPKTPKSKASKVKLSNKLSEQIATFLEMPDVHSPRYKHTIRPETPHSILKTRKLEYEERDIASSPMEARYLGDSDEEMETASNHTHYSDSTNKQLRFTIPTPTELDSIHSPVAVPVQSSDTIDGQEMPELEKSMESPPKKFAAERFPETKSYKDTVKARTSLSLSANSSLSDDPNASIESIADIPVTLINSKYTGERRTYTKTPDPEETEAKTEIDIRVSTGVTRSDNSLEASVVLSFVPKTPKGRRSIHSTTENTPLNRSRTASSEREDSPIALLSRSTRSRSRIPELSSRTSPLPAIPEMPKLELRTDPHPTATLLSKPAPIRSRLRTPENVKKGIESPRLEVIEECPAKELPVSVSTRKKIRTRIRTPDEEIQVEHVRESPRNIRSRSKTPEKLMSPKTDMTIKNKKSLSRMVLEANTFSKTKTESIIECTPMKTSKQLSSVMDVTFSPIVNKSVLQSSNESICVAENSSDASLSVPVFTSLHTVFTEESVLHSYQSDIAEQSNTLDESRNESAKHDHCSIVTTLNEDNVGKSVLHSYESSLDTIVKEVENKTELSKTQINRNDTDIKTSVLGDSSFLSGENRSSLMTSDSEVEIDKDWKVEQDTAKVIQQEKEKIVEIEREINEIEGDMSEDEYRAESDSGNEVVEVMSPDESGDENDSEDSSGEEDSNEGRGEVISIEDTDSDSGLLQIDEQSEIKFLVEEVPSKIGESEIENVEDIREVDQEQYELIKKYEEPNEMLENMEISTDPLNQSFMTDDNSESEQCRLSFTAIETEVILEQNNKNVETVKVEKEKGQGDNKNKEQQIFKDERETQNIVQFTENKIQEASIEKVTDRIKVTPRNLIGSQDRIVKDVQKTDGTEQFVESQVKESLTEKVTRKTEDTDTRGVNDTPRKRRGSKEQIIKALQKTDGIEQIVESEVKESLTEKVTQKTEDTDTRGVKDTPRKRRGSKEQIIKDVQKTEEIQIIIENKVQEMSSEKLTHEPEKKTQGDKATSHKRRSSNVEPEEIPKTEELDEKFKIQLTNTDETNEPKTPRKRTQSNASDKSESVPETAEVDLPRTRQRSKTPIIERRILTRRLSKELSDKEVECLPLEELTPRRRTRASMKKDDDVSSVSSDTSIKSSNSKASEEEKGRKGKRTAIASELAVIPEVEDSNDKKDIEEYSASRRITRGQKTILERSANLSPARVTRRTSLDNTVDCILLDKTDSEGTAEPDDDQNSPALTSSARKIRGRRTASETKTVVTPKRIGRSASIDVVVGGEATPVSESPLTTPTRGRRASFTRAIQALHTPKGRRDSTDLKRGEESNPGTPVDLESGVSSPIRRSARRTSTQLTNTPEPGKKTKKGAEKKDEKD